MDHKRRADFTMPYKSSEIIISETQYNRRWKLTPSQKVEIFHRYMTEAINQRQLTREYGVSCRLITFIVNPESEGRNKELLRENKAKGLYKYNRKKHTEDIRNHRRYKQRLFQEGKIILKDGQTIRIQEKQKTLEQGIIASLCAISKMPENMLPHTIYVGEGGEDGYGRRIPVYIMYQLEEIRTDGGCTLYDAENRERFTRRHLHEINMDWLVTVWERYLELYVEQDVWKGNAVAFLKDRTGKPEEEIILLVEASQDECQTYTDNLKAFLGEDKDRGIWTFSFPLDRFEHDVPAEKIIVDYENNPATRVKKMTPLEFTTNINGEYFDDRNNWVRVIRLPRQEQ